MSPIEALGDRVEIEALRGEYTDAGMMRDYDRFASLFTQDGVMRWPHINKEFVGWKFTERVYEVRYADTTPLAGAAPESIRQP